MCVGVEVLLREAAVNFVHDAAGNAEHLDAFQHRFLHRRRHRGDVGAPVHGDAPPRESRVLGRIVEARPDCGHALLGGPTDSVLEMDQVVKASGHRTVGPHGNLSARNPPVRRPVAIDTVLRCGKADRATHVRPRGQRREACGKRRSRSRRRPARGVLQIPGRPRRAVGAGGCADEEIELRHGRLKRHDGAGRLEHVDNGRVLRCWRRVLEEERALSRLPAHPAAIVLDGDRDPFQRPRIAAPVAPFGLPRFLHRLLEMVEGDAIDLRIEGFCPFDLRLQQINGRSLPGFEHRLEFIDRRIAERIDGINPCGRGIERSRREACLHNKRRCEQPRGKSTPVHLPIHDDD